MNGTVPGGGSSNDAARRLGRLGIFVGSAGRRGSRLRPGSQRRRRGGPDFDLLERPAVSERVGVRPTAG